MRFRSTDSARQLQKILDCSQKLVQSFVVIASESAGSARARDELAHVGIRVLASSASCGHRLASWTTSGCPASGSASWHILRRQVGVGRTVTHARTRWTVSMLFHRAKARFDTWSYVFL